MTMPPQNHNEEIYETLKTDYLFQVSVHDQTDHRKFGQRTTTLIDALEFYHGHLTQLAAYRREGVLKIEQIKPYPELLVYTVLRP